MRKIRIRRVTHPKRSGYIMGEIRMHVDIQKLCTRLSFYKIKDIYVAFSYAHAGDRVDRRIFLCLDFDTLS